LYYPNLLNWHVLLKYIIFFHVFLEINAHALLKIRVRIKNTRITCSKDTYHACYRIELKFGGKNLVLLSWYDGCPVVTWLLILLFSNTCCVCIPIQVGLLPCIDRKQQNKTKTELVDRNSILNKSKLVTFFTLRTYYQHLSAQ
jgi:hypothetical protein